MNKINLPSFKSQLKTPQLFSLVLLLTLFASMVLIGNLLPHSPWLLLSSLIVLLGLSIYLVLSQINISAVTAEANLKKTELEAIIENIKDGVLVYDPNFRILDLNGASEEILELTKEELIGRKIDPSFIDNPRYRIIAPVLFPSLAPTVNQISEATWPQIVEINLETPPLKLRTTLNRVLDKNGALLGFLKIIRDQTREKDILQSKEEFVTVASHQLRTPLTAINWAFEHLSKNIDSDPKLNDVVNEGLKLSNQALKTINDLLDITKMEQGQFGYKFNATDLTNFIKEIITQFEPIANAYKVKLNFLPPTENYTVTADVQRLGVALANLIDNAIKYNIKSGSVDISVVRLKDTPFVKISVMDTGVGVPVEEINKLFTKFYRGKNVIQIEPNGSGIGLYITKNIIRRHGGKIGLESTAGRGTTFWFTLPLNPDLIPTKEIVYEET